MADHKFRPSLYLVLGLGLLVRMDLLVPALVICGFLMAFDRQNRRRHLIAALTALATGLAAPTGLRVLYYGDPLPNTYYLKMTGYPALLRISRGGLVLWDFVRQMNWILFLLPLALVFRRRNKAVLLLAVFGGQLAYSVYVGGDAWEWWGGANRYVSVAMPLFFVLFGCAVDAIGRLAVEKLAAAGRGQSHFRGEGAFSKKQDRPAAKIGTVPRERLPAGRSPLRHSYVAALLVTVGMLQFNALRGPQSLRRWVLIEPPLHAADNRQMVRRALLLRKVTRPDARIALAWAGIIPYFADRQMIDISGKNDRTIARLAAHRASDGPGFDHFHPGHLKWDYAHSIGKLRPDVVLQADYPPVEAEEFLAGKYETATIDALTFHFRRQSPRVLWDRLSALVKRPASLQSYTGL